MPKITNLNKSCPLGGRPKNPMWSKYQDISSTKVRCKKCLAILPKRIDRVKIHDKKCSNQLQDRPELAEDPEPDHEMSEALPSQNENEKAAAEPSTSFSNYSLSKNVIQTSESSQSTQKSQGAEVIELNDEGDALLDVSQVSEVTDVNVMDTSRSISQASTLWNMLPNTSVVAEASDVTVSHDSNEPDDSATMKTPVWPISSTPIKSAGCPEASNKSKSIKKQQASTKNIANFVQKTSNEKLKAIKQKWAQFFYKNRISFQIADDATFHDALEETRAGLKHKHILTRKQLAGPLLDEAHEQVISDMKTLFKNKMCVISQDGWSNIHNEPIVATTIHCEGKSFPLDSVCAGSENKTAKYCFELAKKSILNAEVAYGAIIVGFVSDNEPKMKLVRQLILEWKPDIIVYGCSAHYLNLVESIATPTSVLASIKDVQRYFREHHQPAGWLKEKGGVLPQLPSCTRWTSQRACLDTFVKNHPKYVEIRDESAENANKFAAHITTLVDNRLLLIEAKHMLLQLDTISKAINSFQDDHNTLSDCTGMWLKLIADKNIAEDIRAEIERRFKDVATPHHLLGYLIDHRRNDDGDKRIPLTAQQQEMARNFIFDQNDDYTVVLAAYETEDSSIFPKTAFQTSMHKLSPLKYWQYIRQIAVLEPVKNFCSLMMAISSCPPSSAGIERLFSSAGLIHTKLRNRLSNERVAKLVQVYRHFGWKENKPETNDLEEDIELVANFDECN